jgi:molecular chaperone Hsp33
LSDSLSHYHMFDFKARGAVAVVTETIREAQRRHGLDPIATIALGRAIASTALLASSLKQDREFITCSFGGQGLLSRIVAECNGAGHCRGYAAPAQIMAGQPSGTKVPESVSQAIGAGLLTVTRGRFGEADPYRAVIDLASGEIAADVARYLAESEQIPSAIAAGVKLAHDGSVIAAGGVLVQRLGGADLSEDELSRIEREMQTIGISDRLARGEMPDALIGLLQGGTVGWGLLSTRSLVFKCTCSREKMAAALASLGEAQVKEIEAEVGHLEARCPFCADVQSFKSTDFLTH